jgi:hypothetical protein
MLKESMKLFIEFLYFRFIQQEVQNLLHELERRDNECRRLNTQAMNNGEKLEKTSDKLQTLENKSSIQTKEIQVRYFYICSERNDLYCAN